MRILVVDDEKLLVKGIKFNLENEGYTVDGAYDGSTALVMFRENSYDLIILDLMLPVLDGLTVCRKIRETSNVPVIMLTAKSEGSDKLIGFEYGADDYITKPFDILELKARIRVILRRAGQAGAATGDRLSAGPITVDLMQRAVTVEGRGAVDLTAKEFDLLAMLMRNQGLIVTKESLLVKVWGYESDAEDNNVEVYISFLRKKLDHLHSTVKIRTIRMVGYCLENTGV